VDTGSRKENASKQKALSRDRSTDRHQAKGRTTGAAFLSSMQLRLMQLSHIPAFLKPGLDELA
jgi:hypothetical protein